MINMLNCIVEKLTDDAIFIDKNAWLYIAACSVHQNEVREHYIHILHFMIIVLTVLSLILPKII
jgi:hypothetical protein